MKALAWAWRRWAIGHRERTPTTEELAVLAPALDRAPDLVSLLDREHAADKGIAEGMRPMGVTDEGLAVGLARDGAVVVDVRILDMDKLKDFVDVAEVGNAVAVAVSEDAWMLSVHAPCRVRGHPTPNRLEQIEDPFCRTMTTARLLVGRARIERLSLTRCRWRVLRNGPG